ncbi:type IV pilus biogenesis protein PilI [Klebsiella pneumoniae]|uniref:type IV pilus biogenesis protein PilI n=1 Tax=Klebsiella pneumoniae TaxID=573 RepID=UPI001FB9D4C6|nr:PilI type IV pilus biogenesis protein [Klebsiella pneumoniae]
MPQQHPGRLQILVVDAHCKRRLFSTKTPTDPDELARRFCTPDNCLVVVLRDNRFLFRLERAPGSHCRWHKGSSSRWICPYISRHLLSLNPLLARCRRYSRGER